MLKKGIRQKAGQKPAEAVAEARAEAHARAHSEAELRELIKEVRDMLGELALRLAVAERFAGTPPEESRDWQAAAGNALRARAARADQGKVNPAEGRLLRRALVKRGPWLAWIAKASLNPLETESALYNLIRHGRLSLHVPPEEAQEAGQFAQILREGRWQEALEGLGIEVEDT